MTLQGPGRPSPTDLEVFLELTRTYRRTKPHPRRYPPCFI